MPSHINSRTELAIFAVKYLPLLIGIKRQVLLLLNLSFLIVVKIPKTPSARKVVIKIITTKPKQKELKLLILTKPASE